MRRTTLLMLVVGFGLAGCASTRPDLAAMPQRDADLYPWARKQAGVVVAVDQIVDPERMQRYFGADLLEHAVLPVNVIVSNRSDRRITVGPADVLLVQDREVIDPLPLAQVAQVAARASGDDDAAEYAGDLAEVALRQQTLAPNQSYQGVLFFPYARPERVAGGDTFHAILRLFDRGLRMNVGVTDASTGARLHFGPFRLRNGDDGWRDVFELRGRDYRPQMRRGG